MSVSRARLAAAVALGPWGCPAPSWRRTRWAAWPAPSPSSSRSASRTRLVVPVGEHLGLLIGGAERLPGVGGRSPVASQHKPIRLGGDRWGPGPAGQTARGLGSAAGGGPSAGHETDPRAVASDDRGLGADTPQEIPATGWKDIAKRARKEVKADQVPLLAGCPSAFCCRVPGDHRRCSIYGLVVDPHDG